MFSIPGKPPVTFGSPDPDLGHVTLRFADRGVGNRIVRHPALAAGEPVREDYLQRTGMLDKLDGWRGHAERLLGINEPQHA